MSLDNTLKTGLTASNIPVFFAVQMQLPGGNVNLCGAAVPVKFSANGVTTTFVTKDATYGTLATFSTVQEKVADSAPRVQVTLMPPDEASAGALCQPDLQNSRVYIWFGIINESTGLVVGAPFLMWSGRIDTAKQTFSQGVRVVEIDTVCAFERLFAASEGQRLNDVWHQSIWPGETGLIYNVESTVDPVWGHEGPSSIKGVSNTGPVTGNGGGSIWHRVAYAVLNKL